MRTTIAVDRLEGCLLGCALGDALGLPTEGLKPKVIARRFGGPPRFRLVGRTGFVSDDTEQSALVAQSLLEGDTPEAVARSLRRHLRWWFARLPFGVGWATLRSCVRMWLGLKQPGVSSGGNGAAMRSAIIGLVVQDPAQRRATSQALARLTHTHPLAVEAAGYVAELSHLLGTRDAPVRQVVEQAAGGLSEPKLLHAVRSALDAGDSVDAGAALGTTGFAAHSVAACTWALVHATSPLDAIERVIAIGGDTDTHGAIVGSWAGARWGSAALPAPLLAELHDGPFGPTHLRALAAALVEGGRPPRWSATVALLRNLALYPVILAHGFSRLWPFW